MADGTVNQPSRMPTRKVIGGTVGGIVVVIIAFAAKEYAHQDFPAEVGAAVATLVNLGIAYFVKEKAVGA